MDFVTQLQVLLPIASFALAVGTLVSKYRQDRRGAKSHFLTALIIFLVLGTGATATTTWLEWSRLNSLSDEVVNIIGNEQKTYDEILAQVRRPERSSLYRALDHLESQERIGAEVRAIINKADDRVSSVRLYSVRTFNDQRR